ncbi:tropomyosin-like [Camellia sinensis]|uniref:tropomyosin-like n=1 Tax=Camellia sinensis TaxID=4442 RepID=UPI001035C618|nr:tropomyosin-like [Camellia sinensis]
MKKHDELSDLKVLCSAAKSIVLAAQKNYLAHDRMIKVRQSLREAIAENKAQKAEIAKLKAAQGAVAAERDILSQKVDRANEDKQRAVQSTKARYLAELRKLCDANKVAMDKAIEDTEDRGYAQGEKTYERQAYASATQNWLIAEARKEAEEEAAAAQQAEQTTTEASQDAEDEVADREVAVEDGADDDAEENLPEQTTEIAEQTVEAAEQTVDLELD